MMEHSPKYAKVLHYYTCGFWNKTAVANSVTKKWITKDEYEEITGEAYQ